jgi:hypothetical protein
MSPQQSPLVSILLPTHNRADVLPFAIRSALWQTEGDFELLVAGDGCTDNTAAVVATFDDPRIRWFDLPKAAGVGYANRNVVLREARGRFIAYLAHDDLWLPDHLERLTSALEAREGDFAYSRGLLVGVDGTILPCWYNLEVARHRNGMATGAIGISMCTVVHTRAALERCGYWDETLLRSGDKELWHRLVSAAPQRAIFVSDPTSLHFVAIWRDTVQHRRRMRLAGRLLAGLWNDVRPDPLSLPVASGTTLQEAAWQRLAADPHAAAEAIRRAVVQLQDAILWRTQTTAGLIGLRLGLAFGNSCAAAWSGLMRLTTADLRRRRRDLAARTRATLARSHMEDS